MLGTYFKPFSEVLENALDSIASVTGYQIGLVTYDYSWIEKSTNGDCEFCRLIKSTEEGCEKCDGLSWRVQLLATSFKDNCIYKCPYGLFSVVQPLYKDDKYLGSLYCGNFFDRQPGGKGWDDIEAALPRAVDGVKAREAYFQATFMNSSDIYDLQNLMSLLVKSIADLLAADKHNFSKYDKILEYIEKNFQRDITLDDLSQLSSFNPSYISQLFRKKTGLTLTEFISRVRVRKAKELLLKSDMSIGEVAFSVGFQDQNYFSRVFKQVEAFTPREYRKKYII